MHGRFVRYTYSGDAQELGRKAEDGLLPIFQSQPGFRAYSVAVTNGEIFSFSAWETREDAEAANAAAAGWVSENMSDDITAIETQFGEILFSTALGVSTKSGATV
jgi:hypothetical protein